MARVQVDYALVLEDCAVFVGFGIVRNALAKSARLPQQSRHLKTRLRCPKHLDIYLVYLY